MKHLLIYIFALITVSAFSQEDEEKEQLKAVKNAKNLVFEGNDFLGKDDFISAEMAYRQALSELPSEAIGGYNLGTSYIQEGNLDEGLYQLEKTLKTATSKSEKHQIFHNIGNILMQNKKCKEAVEAYKGALRNNPSDDESRYNLALAQECAKEQEDQNQDDDQDDDQDQDKDDENKDKDDQKDQDDENKDDKDKGDQDKKDGDENKDEDGKPKDEKEDEGKENQDPGKDKEEKQKPPQQKPGQMSPQQMKNLLEAMNNQEAKVQEKMNAEKQKGEKIDTDKDW
ncbi:tetratricopeptide repeat protein [Bizionia argentinensis JUB59]|uniref:Tetratricopeptide repeat protein n=1 Tax=Bizionia argentinensis JUB59 TaxID=1046627 RepID=G2ECK2_9FLAO|nr:tetratricopeptide repeat protein [Bizionia argentinensis]EGV43836.2 tetratricopeptide repeat protein [Bizionia argentinensis JUB59]